jgi:hypothetical protein
VRRAAAPLLLVLALAASSAVQAQSLGRLFLTPEQRATLDLRRASRVPDKPAAVVVESPTARIDGQVVRSDGRSTVWVNGQPVREGTQSEGLRVAPTSSAADSVTLAVGEGARRVELKVGESMNRDTGEVRDMLGDGTAGVAATVRPRPSGTPR